VSLVHSSSPTYMSQGVACVGKSKRAQVALRDLCCTVCSSHREQAAACMAASERPARPEHKEVSEYEQREVAKERALTSCVDKHSARAAFY